MEEGKRVYTRQREKKLLKKANLGQVCLSDYSVATAKSREVDQVGGRKGSWPHRESPGYAAGLSIASVSAHHAAFLLPGVWEKIHPKGPQPAKSEAKSV